MKPKDLNTLAWGGLFYGLIFGGYGLTAIHEEGGLGLVAMGAVFTLAGAVGVIFLKKKKTALADENLNRIFYELVKKKNGRITILDFAMATNMNPSAARTFIEQKSIQLVSITEIDEDGTINYIFK